MTPSRVRYGVLMGFVAIVLSAMPGCSGDADEDSAATVKPGLKSGPDPGTDPAPEPPHDAEPVDDPGPVWIIQEQGGSSLDSIWALDESHALVTGPVEDLRSTSNGGETWSVRSSPSMRRIQFLNLQHGWGVNSGGAYSTTDGGTTWTLRLEAEDGVSPTSLCFINPSLGWVTHDHVLYKTTDGGVTWMPFPFGRALRSVKFADAQVGWLSAGTGSGEPGATILRTDDGGMTFRETHAVGNSAFLGDISAVSVSEVWMAGSQGLPLMPLILHSADGGENWEEQASPAIGAVMAVHFVDGDHGWAVGRQIQSTSDGGVTWTVQPAPQFPNFNGFTDVFFVSPSTGWVVGGDGVILKTTTGGQ